MKRCIGLSLLAATCVLPASAQVPAGGEFQVNTFTLFNQWASSAAADPGGGFVVVWTSQHQDGSYLGVFARRYDAAGAPLGPEFQVNTYTTANQYSGSVAVDGAGNFVVAWMSAGQDGSGNGIFARRFDRAGTAQGTEFQVNTYTTGDQGGPAVAFDAARNLTVAWAGNGEGDDSGIFGRRYDAAGSPRGLQFRINLDTNGIQSDAVLGADGIGRTIATWRTYLDMFTGTIYGRRYDASGAPVGGEFAASTSSAASQHRLAADFAGNFVVGWSWWTYTPPLSAPRTPHSGGFVFRRFDAAGNPQSTVDVSFSTPFWTGLAGGQAGDFVVAWQPYSFTLQARRFESSGAPRSGAFQLNDSNAAWGGTNTLASDSVGNLLALWTNSGQDGSLNGVFAQRFGGIVPAALAVDTASSPSANGNGVFEPGEAVDVRPSWRNLNGAAQTFDGAGLAFTGPPASCGPNPCDYTLPDAAGSYGTVADGSLAPCTDCYRIWLTGGAVHPLLHWDATFTERLLPDTLGQTRLWPIHVGDSFSDVPRTSSYYRFVETLLHRGVTAGCGGGAYCPLSPVTREQMAAFALPAREGRGYMAPACSPPNFYADVPETSPFCDVIEELTRRNVVGGCGGGNYCPTAAVTREQMPVFMLGLLQPGFVPPDCTTPLFSDVPASSPYCRWIEELARRGVVGGCGGGNYCPTAAVTREQMAVFLTGTFGLTLYGP
jgi:hypothetical protein